MTGCDKFLVFLILEALVGTLSTRRRVAGLLILTVGVALLGTPLPARAQSQGECSGADEPEDFGPTDISATTGNQALTVAVNAKATVTVLKWPSPSFYDQIKYRTTDRSEPRLGALPNEGALLGMAWRTRAAKKWQFDWLRQWPSSQRWADEDEDMIVTAFRRPSIGLTVTVRDVVTHDEDVLLRHVTVERTSKSRVEMVRVTGFANFNPVFTKTPQAPYEDWCSEEDNDDGATYEKAADAIVHARSGTDASTGAPSEVALAMAFLGDSEGHSVGADTYSGAAGTSAYDDAADGRLSGDDAVTGQADAALVDQLSLAGKRSATSTLAIVAGVTPDESLSLLQETRERSAARMISAKARWWRLWLSRAALPKGPSSIVDMAKRSLIVMRQATDPVPREDNQGGLIVASVATQPPLGLDWVRHGAYVNSALHAAGHPEEVFAHNIRYAQLQATATERPRGAAAALPAGNWAQNYYTDGVVGGPIPYEIDETGLGMWTLYEYFDRTGDRDYLERRPEVYEAIQRAAQYLTDVCRDLASGLHCPANERDNPSPSQTLVGAQAVWLGLGAAAKAANALGTATSEANAIRWSDRRAEVGAGIRNSFFDEDCTCYTEDHDIGGTLLWPVRFLRYGSDEANGQAEVNFRPVSRAMRGTVEQGSAEVAALLGNAYAWKSSPADLQRVKRGLLWVAGVPGIDRTDLLGEGWMRFPGERGPVTTISGQPHVPTHAMFYLAALRAYGKKGYSFR